MIFLCILLGFPGREKRPVKSLVVGRPILLALEDIDGGPSFLEKALRFLENFGTLMMLIKLKLREKRKKVLYFSIAFCLVFLENFGKLMMLVKLKLGEKGNKKSLTAKHVG